jgi:ATP-dependent HslUV protease ATP-binding subunit HslU
MKVGQVKTIRNIVEKQEQQKKIFQKTGPELIKKAIKSVEEEGIVFIDEIDKICGGHHYQADASDEGVQRDLLPIIEGTKVKTDHGEVDTSKILFITAGAFLQNKPSDLLAELLGRLPIRVKLTPLTRDDLFRILSDTEIDLITQNRAMMRTEAIDLRFSEEALHTIADMSFEVNEKIENIGARRLFTVMEKVMEEFSFNASNYKDQTVIIDSEYVKKALKPLLITTERSQYIL